MSSLIQNTTDLQVILEKVNTLPDSPESSSSEINLQEKTVTPTTSTFVVVPDTDYDGLSKVTVNGVAAAAKQVKTGTFTTNSSGAATVNCGFKPDVVVVYAPENSKDGYTYNTSCSIDILGYQIGLMVLNGKYLSFNISGNSTGFDISSAQTYTSVNFNSNSWSGWAQYSNKKFSYEAIKY